MHIARWLCGAHGSEKMPSIMGWKVGGELKQFLQVALYMYACFIMLLLYTASISGAHVGIAHAGTALLKSLLLAKFVLLSHWLRLGEGSSGWRGIYSVLYQALAMWVFLILLTVIEKLVETWVRGQSIATAFGELHGQALVAVLAHSLILFLVLLPYVAFRQLSAILGPGEMSRIFLQPRT
jgi:hypothetical protein